MENAEQMVRNAISGSPALQRRNVRVFAQGSYRNRTNIRQESDVDIGVLCTDTFFFDLPDGATRETFSIAPATYSYADFKADVGQALIAYFGNNSVTQGSKAFDIKATSYHVDADVAPFFEHRRYQTNGVPLLGVEMQPDGFTRIVNWPEQHYENGNAKNKTTGRRYRAVVRVLKSLRCEMIENNIHAARLATSFLCECLIWNVPEQLFGSATLVQDFQKAINFLAGATATDDGCKHWLEVSELKWVFHPTQKWTRQDAHAFLVAIKTYLNF
jgi:hypothetical protein